MTTRRTLLRGGVAATLAASSFGRALAQDKKPLTILVGFAAGGSPDLVARTLADKLGTVLGRTVVVDNRAGAGGQIAIAALQNAPADGSVYALTPPHLLTTTPILYSKLPYDPAKIEPVVSAVSFEFGVAAGANNPARTFAEYVALVKQDPKLAFFGIPAPGSSPHFLGTVISRVAGIQLQSVPYKGGPPMVADLLGGQLPLAINVLSNFTEYHRNGKLRVLATTGAQRNPLLPDVPTLSELGYKQAEAEEWYAFVARAGVPAQEKQALARAVREVIGQRDVRATLIASGHTPAAHDAAWLRDDLARSRARWSEIIKSTNFKIES